MQSLIDNARTFPDRIADRRAEFAELARGQRPQALFISCSDSRLVPSLLTGARPGDVFELRTAGNIVPPHRPQAACGVAGTLEFAVTALDVPDIVVCGHTHCGAVQGLMHRQKVRGMPLVQRWLERAGLRPGALEPRQSLAPDAGRACAPDAEQAAAPDPDEVARRHLLTQLDHLRSYPCVSERLAAGRLRLHAWFYAVASGEVLAHQPGTGGFRPL